MKPPLTLLPSLQIVVWEWIRGTQQVEAVNDQPTTSVGQLHGPGSRMTPTAPLLPILLDIKIYGFTPTLDQNFSLDSHGCSPQESSNS